MHETLRDPWCASYIWFIQDISLMISWLTVGERGLCDPYYQERALIML